MKYQTISAHISKCSGVQLGPPSQEQLEKLSALNPPESLLSFYEQYAPNAEIQIGNVRLQTIDGLIEESTNYVPGADLRPHGFITFATTICGDAYCTDSEESKSHDPPIVIMAHEVSFEEMDRATVLSARKHVAGSLEEFLTRFLSESLDTEPNYPE